MKFNTTTTAIMIVGLITALFLLGYWKLSHVFVELPLDSSELRIGELTYDLNNPARLGMDDELTEISGIALYDNSNFVCVEDENGRVYLVNQEDGELIRSEKFGKDGDYEDIEVVRDTVYVIKSNGDVIYFKLENEGIGHLHEIKTHLTSKNNTEGLCFDPTSNSLLITCKEKNDTPEYETNDYAIYQITLDDKDFKKKPYLTITKQELADLYNQYEIHSKNLHISPSAIAVHPVNRQIVILSSVSRVAITMDQNGNLKWAANLPRSIFKQPEGLCFDENGTMFISNEGRGGEGNILSFNPQ